MQLCEERGQLALILVEAGMQALDLVLAALLVVGELLGELLSARLDLAIPLGGDALNLHPHPVSDPGDLAVGLAPQLVRADLGALAQCLDCLVDRATQPRQARFALVISHLAHRRDER